MDQPAERGALEGRSATRPVPTDRTRIVDDVAVLRWPADAHIGDVLTADVGPRLLLVEADDSPLLVWDRREDWSRAGASPGALASHAERVDAEPAAPAAPSRTPAPVLDADGIVRTLGGRWAVIPPIEARLLAPLLDRPGHAVRRTALRRAAWPDDQVSERALDGRMKLLRRRIRPLGLTIHTVRGLGFVLEVCPPPP